MGTVFLDESGYTGPNLLDEAQPIFALASHDFSEEEATAIKALHFGSVRSKELKSSALLNKSRGQRMVVQFLADMKHRDGRTRIAYMHKPFALLAKAVDWILEPAMRRGGYDLNDKGENLALCNVLFFMLEEVPEYRDRLLWALHQFLINPGRVTHAHACDTLIERTGWPPRLRDDPLGEMLRGLLFATATIDDWHLSLFGKENLDLCLTLAKTMMSAWRRKFGPNMVLYHDETTNMANQKDQWDAFTSPDVEEAIVGYDRRTEQYPIGVVETRFESSLEWAGLQLADVLAGVVARCMRVKYGFAKADSFSDDLWSQMQGWPLCGAVTPEPKFTPEELGTDGPKHTDPIEHGAKLFGPSE